MTKRVRYSFVADSPTDPRTGELPACPRSRYQALTNRLSQADWLDWAGLVWRWARGRYLCTSTQNRRARVRGRRY